jgi:hypothetical protein
LFVFRHVNLLVRGIDNQDGRRQRAGLDGRHQLTQFRLLFLDGNRYVGLERAVDHRFGCNHADGHVYIRVFDHIDQCLR